jgi:hypothetical protein
VKKQTATVAAGLLLAWLSYGLVNLVVSKIDVGRWPTNWT